MSDLSSPAMTRLQLVLGGTRVPEEKVVSTPGVSPPDGVRPGYCADLGTGEQRLAATTTRKVLTVHAPLQEVLALGLLNDIEESLKMRGAQRVWIATDSLPDLVIMAEVPEEGS